MFIACCLPYLTRRQLVISNKAKVVVAGEETLLCALELKTKDTSASLNDIRLKYELFARSSRVVEPNVAHCCLSLISREKCNIFINVSTTTVVKLTKVKLDLGWKFRLADNEIKLKIKTGNSLSSPVPSRNSSKPDLSVLSSSDEYGPRLPKLSRLDLTKSPVSQLDISPSPSPTESSFSFSDYEAGKGQRITSYHLSNAQVSAHHSSVEAAMLPDGIGIIQAGTPAHFKVKMKDDEGKSIIKRTKFELMVKLGGEAIFSGATRKTVFKLTKTQSGDFTVLFFINDEPVPGGPFYVNVIPLAACSLSNFTFDEDLRQVKRYKTQFDMMYVGIWMICRANIVDKYGNRIHKDCEVNLIHDKDIDVTAVHVHEGYLQFKTRAEETGNFELSFVLKEDLQNEVIVKKTVHVKELSMDDQFVFTSYV